MILDKKKAATERICAALRMVLDYQMVEPGGIEPPSASPLQQVLHAYPVYLVLTTVFANRQAGQWRVT